jgi:hypothetical protein
MSSVGMDGSQGVVMRGLTNLSIAQYAVIEARWPQGSSERFVCTYSNERSLRDLIAGPSIIASGFASREEALANLDANPGTAAWERIQRRFALRGASENRNGLLRRILQQLSLNCVTCLVAISFLLLGNASSIYIPAAWNLLSSIFSGVINRAIAGVEGVVTPMILSLIITPAVQGKHPCAKKPAQEPYYPLIH